MKKRVPRRGGVVWAIDRRSAGQLAVMAVLVAMLSLAAGLLIRGLGGPVAPGDAMSLMAVDVGRETGPANHVAPVVEQVAQEMDEPVAPQIHEGLGRQAGEGTRPHAAQGVGARETAPVVEEAVEEAEAPAAVTFDGRPLRKVKVVKMKVTAYSPDAQSCGLSADGITASGYSVWTNGMRMVAADTRLLPFGSLVSIPGYHDGKPVPVLDRGGAIKGHRLDVLYPTHEIAMQWGVQDLDVVIWEYAD